MQGCCTLHVHSNHTPWRCHRSPVKQCGNVWCLLGCRSHFLPNLECCTVPNDYLTSHGGVITSQQRICVWVLRCALICPTLLSGWWDLAWPALWLSRSVRSVLFDLLLRVVLMWSAICCCGLLRFALLCFLFVAICPVLGSGRRYLPGACSECHVHQSNASHWKEAMRSTAIPS